MLVIAVIIGNAEMLYRGSATGARQRSQPDGWIDGGKTKPHLRKLIGDCGTLCCDRSAPTGL